MLKATVTELGDTVTQTAYVDYIIHYRVVKEL